jgi:hypothetical protein
MPNTLPPRSSGGLSGGEPDRRREELLGPSRADKKSSIAVVTYPGVALLDLVATKKVLDRPVKASRYWPVSFGSGILEYDHLDALSTTARAGSSLVAPFIAAGPKQLTMQNR